MSQSCGCHGNGPAAGDARACAGGVAVAAGPEETVDAIGRRWPGALAILRGVGIDTCCGGSLTLRQAAVSAGVPLDTVVRLLAEGQAGSAA